MKTTEGAWLPFVSIMGGAIGSGIGNIAYQLSIRRSWSWSSFGWAMAKGAVMAPIGGYAWKAGVRAYRTFRRLPPAVVKPTPPIRQAVTVGTIQGVTTFGGIMGYDRYRYHHRYRR